MLGENEESNVQSYIQTQNTRIAYEILLTLQCLSEATMAMQGCQSKPVGGAYAM